MKKRIEVAMWNLSHLWDWVCEHVFGIMPYDVELTISNAPSTKYECEDLEFLMLDEGADCRVTIDGKVKGYHSDWGELHDILSYLGHKIERTEVIA